MKNMNPCKVIFGENTLFSYANLLQPKAINGAAPKYSVSLIFRKDSEDVQKVKDAIEAAYTDGLAKLKGNSKVAPALSALKTPLRDGDAERPGDEIYAGCYFINCNNTSKPGVVDTDMNPILDPEQVFSGCRGKASVTFYAYSSNGNRGIAASINNVMVCDSTGPRLGGHSSPAEDFGEDDLLK